MSPPSLLRVRRPLSRALIIVLMTSILATVGLRAESTPDAMPNGTPGATPVAGDEVTLTFNPDADAYVVQETPDDNYGEAEILIIDEEPMSVGYIQFQVEGVEPFVGKATLRVWASNGTRSAPELWLSPPMSLEEDSVTWITRPALDDPVQEGKDRDVPEGNWLEFDVSAVVRGDGTYTFALIPTATDGVDITSREGSERQPELVLQLRGEESSAAVSPGIGDEPILLAAGDIATCDGGGESTARILDEEPGMIAALGDTVYDDGTAEEFAECYDPSWGRHKDRTMPVPGNHEYYSSEADPYFNYFGESAGEPGQGYYSYSVGSWQVIGINTNIQIEGNSDQMAWLRAELEENTAQCTLIYGHHPRFSSGSHGSIDDMDPFFTTLYDHGVELYLAGHEHDYERFLPQDPGGNRDDEHGVRQFVIGTGGKDLRPFGEPAPNSEVRQAEAFGIVRFMLHEDGYEWEFLAVEDESFYDSGEGGCHDAPPEPWSMGSDVPDGVILADARRDPRMASGLRRE